ncbi:MAG: 16S rRNA (uracil(1498)-N(3))-methyltransferase, partial [Dehalococcoidia bacterium]
MAHVPRLYHPGRIVPGPLALGPEASRHLTTVLRMRVGEEFLLFPGDGSEWLARIEGLSGKQGAWATVMELVRQEPSAALLQVELCCALVRNARFETVVEKCTELGVDVIRPMSCERTNRGDAPSAARKERWERITVEA